MLKLRNWKCFFFLNVHLVERFAQIWLVNWIETNFFFTSLVSHTWRYTKIFFTSNAGHRPDDAGQTEQNPRHQPELHQAALGDPVVVRLQPLRRHRLLRRSRSVFRMEQFFLAFTWLNSLSLDFLKWFSALYQFLSFLTMFSKLTLLCFWDFLNCT